MGKWDLLRAFAMLMAGFAGGVAKCPREGENCPKLRVLWGFILGVVAAVVYILVFLGGRVLECCDLIAIILVAYLFTYFIDSLFPGKKTP
ncbi:MAG: hypothetical protein JXB23_05535 [Candidatus Aminicenantes bacterium]|nr:hypothetical protein [Candidatus Aminicenantes bacterium]